MIKVIIKNTDGSKEVKELTDGMVIKPEPGQQFYFDNLDAKKYKFNLSDGGDSIEILFNKDGQRYTFKFEDMAKLIKESSSLTENKSVLGIINDQEGMDELNQTVLNPEFKSDNIIRELKDLLAQTDGNANQNGIIIDDFGALAEQLDAAAAGETTSNGSSTFFTSDAVSGNTYGAEGRGTGLEFNDPDGNLVGVEGTTNRDNNTPTEGTGGPEEPSDPGSSTEPYNGVITLGNLTTFEGTTDATITATVSNPPSTDLIITLDNGSTITIQAGTTTGTSTPFSVQGDDVFKDAGTETVTITGITGGGYDNLDTSDESIITVTDTEDTTNATLTSSIEGNEDGATVTYKITLDHAPTTDETFTFKVD
ncbi:MAG: hypothetical protein HWD90_11565, partial [Campylobacteraceae bacterium]|nr:hypothetical protein [Campylobacteraceae bacterium]